MNISIYNNYRSPPDDLHVFVMSHGTTCITLNCYEQSLFSSLQFLSDFYAHVLSCATQQISSL